MGEPDAMMSGVIPFDDQVRILRSGAAAVIPDAEFDLRLKEAIEDRRPLRVKLGLDPTASHVHLGWTVVLRKLRQFQDLGHQAVLIIGDFTAQVGDPSGKSETRKPLSESEVRAYAEALLDQFRLVLDLDRLEIRWNSEWLAGMDMRRVLQVTSQYTVARMLERDDFAKRYASGSPISVVEFLYPLMQGYDSVVVDADVELGGTDQTFNLLVGRDLQERIGNGQRRQIALTMPILEGTDGVHKMSQSLGNYIGITEPADDMFGKVMRIPDSLIGKYFRLVTDLGPWQVDEIEAALLDGTLAWVEAKRRLASEVVRLYHGAEAADEARAHFDRVHKERRLPTASEIEERQVPAGCVDGAGMVWVPRLLAELGLAASNGEGRRLIVQGGVRLDGDPVGSETLGLDALAGRVLQVGRRRFVRLAAGSADDSPGRPDEVDRGAGAR
ncbi:MAG TPA: tyrosine--tRNA ligase [Actinomycetota bacterium]|nr:tyrosine--tRNA ligase [Actinomycetota bacterium]